MLISIALLFAMQVGSAAEQRSSVGAMAQPELIAVIGSLDRERWKELGDKATRVEYVEASISGADRETNGRGTAALVAAADRTRRLLRASELPVGACVRMPPEQRPAKLKGDMLLCRFGRDSSKTVFQQAPSLVVALSYEHDRLTDLWIFNAHSAGGEGKQ